ncbi:MAG: hypothetical protein WA777_01750 [Rhodanobacter sp.]
MSETYYYGQGRISVATRDATTGVLGKWRWVGDVSALSVKLSVEKVTHNESYSGQVAQTRTINTKKTATLDMTMHQLDPDNLSLSLYGTTQTTPGSSVTGEVIPAGLIAGDVFYLANPGVANVVVTDSTATPKTLVAGTDYLIEDPAFARCRLLNVGTYTQPFKAAYKYGDRKAVGMFTAPQPNVAVRYEAINLAEGNAPVMVDLYKVATDPLQELALISSGNDVAGMQVSGGILLDSSKPATGALGQFGTITQITPATGS